MKSKISYTWVVGHFVGGWWDTLLVSDLDNSTSKQNCSILRTPHFAWINSDETIIRRMFL